MGFVPPLGPLDQEEFERRCRELGITEWGPGCLERIDPELAEWKRSNRRPMRFLVVLTPLAIVVGCLLGWLL